MDGWMGWQVLTSRSTSTRSSRTSSPTGRASTLRSPRCLSVSRTIYYCLQYPANMSLLSQKTGKASSTNTVRPPSSPSPPSRPSPNPLPPQTSAPASITARATSPPPGSKTSSPTRSSSSSPNRPSPAPPRSGSPSSQTSSSPLRALWRSLRSRMCPGLRRSGGSTSTTSSGTSRLCWRGRGLRCLVRSCFLSVVFFFVCEGLGKEKLIESDLHLF